VTRKRQMGPTWVNAAGYHQADADRVGGQSHFWCCCSWHRSWI